MCGEVERVEERFGEGEIPFVNDVCSVLVHFRIVTLNSSFVPVNDKVRIKLGRVKERGLGQPESTRVGKRRDSCNSVMR